MCVFITAGPITKLFAGGEEESGGRAEACVDESAHHAHETVDVCGEKVSFINENTPRAPTGTKNTRKPARLAILK